MDYIAEKLAHPSSEVRGRALESLEFKWKYGLVTVAELQQDRKVLRGLLSLLNIGDGIQTTAVVLLLLHKMAAADSRLAKALLELGALQQLHATPVRSGRQLATAAAAQESNGSSACQATTGTPALYITPGVWPEDLLSSVEALANLLLSPGAASTTAAAAHVPAALAAAATQCGSVVIPSSARRGHQQSKLPGEHNAGQTSRPGSSGSHWLQDSVAAGRQQQHHGRPATGDRHTTDGDDRLSLLDERLLRARARADWRQQEGSSAAGIGGHDSCGTGAVLRLSRPGPSACHVTLPVVTLSASDDQLLFELNVRLQYSDDERLLLPALLELASVVGVDMPAEAVLQRQSILDNCLALVGSSSKSQVQSAAAAVLLQVVCGLKASLALAAHPELARSAYGDAVKRSEEATAAGSVGLGQKSSFAAFQSALKGQSKTQGANGIDPRLSVLQHGNDGRFLAAANVLPGFRTAAETLAIIKAPVLDPSCPNSYPQLPLPEQGVGSDGVANWQLPVEQMGGQQSWVDVTAAVNSICLQVMELLKQPSRHWELLPIVEAAFPLLTAPLVAAVSSHDPGSVGQQQQQQLQQQALDNQQAMLRGMLGAISRAIASSAAVAAADRAAAVAASLSGSRSDSAAAAAMTAVTCLGAGGDAAPGAVAVVSGDIGVACGGLLCWDLPTLNLLLLALRFIKAAPSTWCTVQNVPPNIADAAAAAACDEAVALLLPELRPAAQLVLQHLRPSALNPLEAAMAVEAAAVAAREVAGLLLQQLQQQPVHCAPGWLDRVEAATRGLGFSPRADARLLQCIMHGLYVIISNDSSDASQQRAGRLVVSLLSHPEQQVQHMTLQLSVAQLTDSPAAAANAGQQSAANHCLRRQLLLMPQVIEHLVVHGLAKPQHCQDTSRVLLTILEVLGSSAAECLMPWRCWVSCSVSDNTAATAAPLAEALDVYQQQALEHYSIDGLHGQQRKHAGCEFWHGPLVGVLQDLFSCRSDVRKAAGRRLMKVLSGDSESLDEYQECVDDPFKGLLEPHSTCTADTNQLHKQRHHLLPPDPLTDTTAALAVNFSPQDVTNLLGVLQNQGLAQELRRAAAEELLVLSPEPGLLAVMTQPKHLEVLWALCLPQWSDENDPSAGNAANLAIGAGAPGDSIFDMQLSVAALNLLAGLLARSSSALQWMCDAADGLLVPLLPLVLHTLHSVRRSVARVLAITLFGNAVHRWTGYSRAATREQQHHQSQRQQQQQQQRQAALLPEAAPAIMLPEPFLRQYRFPFRVLPVPVICKYAITEHAQGSHFGIGNGHQQLQQQNGGQQEALLQHNRIKQLVQQQQLLRFAGYDTIAARRLVQDCLPVELQHISQRVLSATANQLANVDYMAVAQRLLAAVAAAGSHAECERAVRQLQVLGSNSKGLQAIANSSEAQTAVADTTGSVGSACATWESAFDRLLAAAPVTADDQWLWLHLLQLVERMLAAGPLTAVQYIHLQCLLQRSVTTWLQQPTAAADIPRPPLALTAGSNSWKVQQHSSGAAAAAVAEMVGIGSGGSTAASSTAAAGAGASDASILAVQVSRQALLVLLQLVKAVKHHCSIVNDTTCCTLAALQPATILQLLSNRLMGCADAVDYGCRNLASAVLLEIVDALQTVAQYRQLYKPHETAVQHASLGLHPASQRHKASVMLTVQASAPVTAPGVAAAPAAQQEGTHSVQPSAFPDEAAVLVEALESLICKVLMPVAGRSLPGFRGKSLVKTTLQVLLVVVEGPIVSEMEWAQAWAAIGGTFWLSRLARDREASIRQLALSLVAQLLSPRITPTQHLIATNWPDCGNRLLRVAGDVCEAHAVRAAAVRALAAALVIPVNVLQPQQQRQEHQHHQCTMQRADDPQQDLPGTAATTTAGQQRTTAAAGTAAQKLQSFGLGALLQTEQLWQELLPSLLLSWHQLPPDLVAATAAVAAAAVAAEPDGVGRRLLLLPGVAAAALQIAAAPLQGYACNITPHQNSNSLAWGQATTASGHMLTGWWDAELQQYVQELQQFHLYEKPQYSSTHLLLHTASGQQQQQKQQQQQQQQKQLNLGNSNIAMAAAQWHQHAAAITAASAASVQLLALAVAPASTGGALLLLPATVQKVLRGLQEVLMQLISMIGNNLVTLDGSNNLWVSRISRDAPAAAHAAAAGGGIEGGMLPAGPHMLLLQRQMLLVETAAATLAGMMNSLPSAQPQQRQLLQLLQLLQEQGLERIGSSTQATSSSSRGSLAVAVAHCMGHPGASQQLKLMLAQLVDVLMSDAAVAAAALGVQPTAAAAAASFDTDNSVITNSCSDELLESTMFCEAKVLGFKGANTCQVGAALCHELAALLPSGIFQPVSSSELDLSTAAAAGSENGVAASPSVASPEGLAVVLAMQNLLSFSRSAKAAAVQIGLQKLCMDAARALTAAVAAGSEPSASSASKAVAAIRQSAGSKRMRARWFSSTTLSPTGAAASGQTRGVAAERGCKENHAMAPGAPAVEQQQGCRRAAGPKQSGSRPQGSKQQQLLSQQRQTKLQTDGSITISAATEAPEAASSSGAGAAATLDGMDPMGSDAASTAAAVASEEVLAEVDNSRGSRRQHLMAYARTVNQRKLLLTLVLLRHLAYRCYHTQAALVGDGLVDLMLHIWPTVVQHIPLLLELLRLLSNLLPTCYQARLAAAALVAASSSSNSRSTLLQHMLSLLLQQVTGLGVDPARGVGSSNDSRGSPALHSRSGGSSSSAAAALEAAAGRPDVIQAAAAAVLHYGSTDDGAANLVKPGSTFLQDAQRRIRHCLLSAQKEHEPLHVRRAQQERLTGVLQLLAMVAGRLEGQRAMLRATLAPGLVDLLVEVLLLPRQPAAVASATLLLLRNLAFHADSRSPVLANQLLLPLLLAAAECLQPLQQQAGQQQQLGLRASLEYGLKGSGANRVGSAADSAAQQWMPLYGKPVKAPIGVKATARAAAAAGSRPGSPAVAAAAAGGAADDIAAGNPVTAAAVPGALGNVCCAVYAVSALWALMYQGEKVKAAVRRLPDAMAKLAAVHARAGELMTAAAGNDVGSSCGKALTAVCAEPGSLCSNTDVIWWLQQLQDSCCCLIDTMESV